MLYEQLMIELIASNENRYQNAAQPSLTAGMMLPDVEDKFADAPFLFEKPIYQWMNLEIDFFPPSSHWKEDELKVLWGAMRQLFGAYNFYAAIPWDIPLTLEYDSWLALLKQPSICLLTLNDGSGMEYLDICKGNEAQCPFGKDCLKEGEQHCFEYLRNENWQRYFL